MGAVCVAVFDEVFVIVTVDTGLVGIIPAVERRMLAEKLIHAFHCTESGFFDGFACHVFVGMSPGTVEADGNKDFHVVFIGGAEHYLHRILAGKIDGSGVYVAVKINLGLVFVCER